MYQKCIDLLNERGVTLNDIGECVLYLQGKYYPDLTMEIAIEAIKGVIEKREVQHAIITGLFLDKSAETDMCDEELKDILMRDAGLYGIDEVLAYGICNLCGSIALTNYGYIDKVKPLIIGRLNDHHDKCNTFLDDIIGAIAASAASKLAHSNH